MESPTGIIPEELLYRERKQDVIRFLMAAPYPSDFKRRLLEGWALWVGLRIRGADYRAVERTGVDVKPF